MATVDASRISKIVGPALHYASYGVLASSHRTGVAAASGRSPAASVSSARTPHRCSCGYEGNEAIASATARAAPAAAAAFFRPSEPKATTSSARQPAFCTAASRG